MAPSTTTIQQKCPICEHRHFHQTTVEACKAAVEAYAASLFPPNAMYELVLNLRASKSSWRTLSELYTLRKLEYHRTVPVAPTPGQFVPSELSKPVGRSWSPGGIGSPRCHSVAQGHWDLMALRLMGQVHPLPAGLLRSINRSFPLTFIVRGDAYPVAGSNWTQLTISLANFDRLPRSPFGC